MCMASIGQRVYKPSVQSLVDRPRRTGGRPKAGPPAYAKPSARMCPIEESRLSTPFQPACGRACREVSWMVRTLGNQNPSRTPKDRTGQMHQATVYPPSRVKRTRGSLFGPRTFSPSAPPPVICSPFPAHAKHVTPPACVCE